MNEQPNYITKFQNATPFASEEFTRVFNLAMGAITHKNPKHDPTKRKFQLEEEDGSVSEYSFTDKPMARATLAIAEHYANDKEKYFGMTARLFALMNILSDKELDKWRRETKGGFEIHDAVIDAAATVKLNKNGEFPKKEFLKEVESIIQEKYSEKGLM